MSGSSMLNLFTDDGTDLTPKNSRNVNVPASGLKIASTAVTSTANELNLVDGSAAGTVVNSKAVIYGASGEVDMTTLKIASTTVTSTADELNYNDVTTPGTIEASKAVIVDANKDVSGFRNLGSDLFSVDLLELKRSVEWYSKTQITVKSNAYLINATWFYLASDTEYAIAEILDTGSISNGKDYYVYACNNAGSLTFKVSLASTYPSGYDANSSRKIGGFHTLCVSVGTISGHTLTGYVANDILPASVWDLSHRPISEPAGMVYVEPIDAWVDIYLTSGTGASTLSVYGGTISDTRNWMNFVDDGAAVKKRLMRDAEFQIAAGGSNEGTNISTSADPVTTGGHNDTAARRMISNYGIEDMCGVVWQWLDEQSYRFGGAVDHTHQITVSGDPETVTSGNPSVDVAPTFSYKDETGGKGKLNTQGTYGDVKLLAGGAWGSVTSCGSRGRDAIRYRWYALSAIGGRFASVCK